RGRIDRGRHAVSERRDLCTARCEQARARGTLPCDGHHGFPEGLSCQGSGPRGARDLRRDWCDRRHADARRQVFWRRCSDELGDHAERPAPHPVHRQHPCRVCSRREDSILSTRFVVHADTPDTRVLEEVAAMIVSGAVVAIPTDTLYGLAVDPFNAAAVARVFAVKGRAGERALPLIAADRQQVARSLGDLPPLGLRLADRFCPGPLTLLLAAPVALAAEVTGATGRVGVRVPAHAVARALCRLCSRPLTATSANLSGNPPSRWPDDVEVSLGDRIDAIVDAGATAGGQASTIVDVSGREPLLVRSGAIPWDDVRRCLTTA